MLPFNLAPRLDTVSRGQQGFPFRSTNGAAAPGEVWAAARQTGPRRAVPLVLLYAVFATHPQRGEYSRPPVAPAVIAPQHRRPRGEGWRVPQGSPASPWEGVSKFHYPPRCRRARPATAGSKVRVDRSVRSAFTSLELPSWRRAFCRYSHGFLCLEYCVFSCRWEACPSSPIRRFLGVFGCTLERKIQIFFQTPQALVDRFPDVALLHVLRPGNLAHAPPQDEARMYLNEKNPNIFSTPAGPC